MASAPNATNLPLFYKDLMPLNSRDHVNYKSRGTDQATWLVGTHAVPLTAEEFIHAGRFYPIVFASAEQPVPLALMGLNEGVNLFVDDEGKLTNVDVYIPAYARRYPFMLAKLQPDSDELSLCFDPTSNLVANSKRVTRSSMAKNRAKSPRACSNSARTLKKQACAPSSSLTS